MNSLHRLTAAALLVSGLHVAFAQAQNQGLLYPPPAASSAAAARPSTSASAPSAVAPMPQAIAASGAARVAAALPPTPSASSARPSGPAQVSALIAASARDSAPAPAAATAGIAPSIQPASPQAVRVGPSGASSVAQRRPDAEAELSKGQPPAPKPTVTRRPDGTQVFRTSVTAAMAEEEQRVLASTQPPAMLAQGQPAPVQASSPPGSSLASFLGAGATLPKWAVEGTSRTNGQTKLVVSQGVTEMVKIARNFPNRFITPFEAAEVVTTDESLGHDGVGGAVLLSTGGDKPIGVFIQDKYSDRSIGLVLIPEDIPQRELRLVLDDTWTSPVLRPNPDAPQSQLPGAQNEYVEFIKSALRAMAKGEVPDGHALTPINPEEVPRCQVPGLSVKPAQMLDGPTTRIAVYVATNTTQATLPFQESGCYRKGVLAVSAFPRPVLDGGQSTEVYVLLRKDTMTQTISGKRRPVLVSQ